MLSVSAPVLPVIELTLEILHIRNVRHFIPTAENEVVVEVHECKCQESTLYILAS